MKRRTLAIVSGGMDSTVLAHKLSHDGELIGIVSVNYGQRHCKELLCARAHANFLGVPHHLLDLAPLRDHLSGSSLTSDLPVPHGHYAEDSMKATVVPNRNMILLALAVGVGVNLKATHVAYGAHAGDHAVYPDCRPEFADAMRVAISLCDYSPPDLIAPFVHMTKAEVVRMGLELGVLFEETWTCYEGGDLACGRCGTCVERLEAFALCGAEDPLPYVDREFWRTADLNGLAKLV